MTTILVINAMSSLLAAVGLGSVFARHRRRDQREVAVLYVRPSRSTRR